MNKVRTFTVIPDLPAALRPLRDLAYNLWWCWTPSATELFRRLDFDLWEAVYHNPVRLLGQISQQRLEQIANDSAYLAHMTHVMDAMYIYMSGRTWFDENYPDHKASRIAYFSAEFGLTECLPIYSGGLGVLAGDHLKSASDLGLPLTGVGLLYRQGYFSQRLTSDGWQQEDYPDLDFHQLPVSLVLDEHGKPMGFSLAVGERPVAVQIWKVQVGRVTLYLLDADLPENRPDDRQITSRLYGGDETMRIRQEILLGIGGLRALGKLGIEPTVCHMNEGHSAFLAIERIRQLINRDGLGFAEAREAVTAGNIFTTHTPVPAGIDRFPPSMMDQYFSEYVKTLGISRQDFLAMGRVDANDANEPFSMAVLALRLSGKSNAVSQLHRDVSRRMWKNVWPQVPHEEVPITSVTNGVHIRSWISLDMAELYDRYLGPEWADQPQSPHVWSRVDQIPDSELWRTHERRRERLVAVARRRLHDQLQRRGAPPAELKAAEEILDPDALTIGFARRFAPYKRGTLLLRDMGRLTRLLCDRDRPVQILFAGKAHPRDNHGKELIKQLVAAARQTDLRRRLVFLEDYDINLARYLVQGADIWLNNPQKLMEASGTSGMKPPANGGINCSVLDGWWPEAYNGVNGWAIGDGKVYGDQAYQDHIEGEAIYSLLEKEIVPLFYDRGPDGLPRNWIAKMKESVKTICPLFNTHRMVAEYTDHLYMPTLDRWFALSADGFGRARELSEWKRQMLSNWPQVRIEQVFAEEKPQIIVGTSLGINAHIALGNITPGDVSVEVFHGPLDTADRIMGGRPETMQVAERLSDGRYRYEGQIPCSQSGRHGYAVRVTPRHEHMPNRYECSLIAWS